ncbi:hypothetical protein QBC38DRAFT_485950 [Podospora fimiseda]|uniref:Uncharacterized protein n=1 Tax=Podospora fimiseda TaxID=252190 RepID=A0AAN7GR64_9PEZI|nr:hypothetical protein QBC38DRAFT_485950 [Podospora fimiseda]
MVDFINKLKTPPLLSFLTETSSSLTIMLVDFPAKVLTCMLPISPFEILATSPVRLVPGYSKVTLSEDWYRHLRQTFNSQHGSPDTSVKPSCFKVWANKQDEETAHALSEMINRFWAEQSESNYIFDQRRIWLNSLNAEMRLKGYGDHCWRGEMSSDRWRRLSEYWRQEASWHSWNARIYLGGYMGICWRGGLIPWGSTEEERVQEIVWNNRVDILMELEGRYLDYVPCRRKGTIGEYNKFWLQI